MYRRLPAVLFAATLVAMPVLAACGDDDDSDVSADTEPATEDTIGDTAGDGGGPYDSPGETSTTAAGQSSDGAPVTTASSDLGEILVDGEGFTLYGFTNDTDGTPSCTEACADTWPPLFVDSEELPEGLDDSVFSVVEHPSGQFQLVAGDWPLYLYAPDTEPGDTNGQGVGGVWFVVDPQGQLIME
jgi:predicted lipoprotein with Yx(FWY)xxD motif